MRRNYTEIQFPVLLVALVEAQLIVRVSGIGNKFVFYVAYGRPMAILNLTKLSH